MPDTTLTGVVTCIHKNQNPTWTAGFLRPSAGQAAGGREVSFAGKIFVRLNELVTLVGAWEDTDRGRQFRAAGQRLADTATVDDLAAWLAVNGLGRGIGPVKARRIAEAFHDDFAGWLRDNPEQIAIEASVPLECIRDLAVAWEANLGLQRVGLALAAYGLTGNAIRALYDKHKECIVPILQDNPYHLIREGIDGFGFSRVDEIARKLGVPQNSSCRINAALDHCVRKASDDDGSTCIDRDTLLYDAKGLLHYDEESHILSCLADLTTAGSLVRILDRHYATPENARCDSFIRDFVRACPAFKPRLCPGKVRQAASAFRSRVTLDATQIEAVTTALTNRCCVITGGAGTGKTTTIEAVARIAKQNKMTVALCALAGKAARRIAEVMPDFAGSCSTIHRLLDWRPVGTYTVETNDPDKPNRIVHLKQSGFLRGEKSPLGYDVVVVDEFSMVHAGLFQSILRALPPHAILVLVGDHNQLPSIGPGALIRDFIDTPLVPSVVLGTCHRQAGLLKQNCNLILSGQLAPSRPAARGFPCWHLANDLTTPEMVLSAIRELHASLLVRFGFDFLTEVQFLSPVHGTKGSSDKESRLGTAELNRFLQRLHQATLGVDIPADDLRARLRIGDKVILTKNNYDLDVMNGTQGVVLAVRDHGQRNSDHSGHLVVRFEGVEVQVPRECESDVKLAYCLTAHKMQGSEIPCVVVVLSDKHKYFLNRNWFYTAATRAREACILVGDRETMRHAAAALPRQLRLTALSLLLQES